MSFGGCILTSLGRKELARAEVGHPLAFDCMAVGDGNNAEAVTSLESLAHELHRLPIISVRRDGDTVIVDAELSSSELQSGFYFREIGLYANGILYAYDNAGADAEYIDAEGSAVVKQKRIRIALTISSEAVVSVTLDSGLYALQKDFEAANKKMSQMEDKLDGIEENANNYSHPDGPGNCHIPSGGVVGQILKRGEEDGKAFWDDISAEDVGALPKDGTAKKAEQDGEGNNIKETYAKKSIYGDKAINFGRNAGSTVGASSSCLGSGNTASKMNSSVLGGEWSSVSGMNSAVLCGEANGVSGSCSSALSGYSNSVGGHYSSVSGYVNTVAGNNSFAAGEYCSIRKDCGAAFGHQNISDNFSSAAFGKWNKAMNSGGSNNNQLGDAFVVGNGTGESSRSNALRVTYDGNVYGKKAFNASGADFAEYHEFEDGNPNNEDRVGHFVTITENGKIRIANGGDYILGIVSGNPCIVGNADEDYYWMYERDEFGRIVMEDAPELVPKMIEKTVSVSEIDVETGKVIAREEIVKIPEVNKETGTPVMVETGRIMKNARMKLSKDYDPSLQTSYIQRADRPEWGCVGMLGIIPVRDDGTCLPGRFCKCGNGGIATMSEGRSIDTYMVKSRIADNVVAVIMK